VDPDLYQQADRHYAAGDYRAAAKEYLAAAQRDPDGATGHVYHMAGNALMHIRRYGDAAALYGHALNDTTYDKRPTVLANLGAALAADGDLTGAIAAYDEALSTPGYDAAYKAEQGRGRALYDIGRYEEATTSYRAAAWDGDNPDPGKALNNMGLAFMALGKPEEAVETYKAALGLESYKAKGKASANLGLAYAAMGFSEEACRALVRARDTYGLDLTGDTLAVYEKVRAACGPQEPQATSHPLTEAAPAPAPETEEGWSTGEIPPVSSDDVATPESEPASAPAAASLAASTPTAADAMTGEERFFTITDAEMKVVDRDARQAEKRDRRAERPVWVPVVVVVIACLLVAGGLAGAWFAGLGYPMQQQTVTGMVDAQRANQDVTPYWVAVPPTDVKQQMQLLPVRFDSYTIDGIQRGPAQSSVRIKVQLDKNATLYYLISLVREGVGWKVNGIKNDWQSTGF
jgi:tetratricopeptide (TPR) repeat protein